ncbi:MAG: hypothetical protein COU69_03065 [Candidatus Pacebacteria bacterium CG10_big_fil_rev_8_21_14_0_10_56_10]|nr:MAG: hypothetical protein COU69_03065 [Candidatus Pacebacteria bacterium CG10_big_fil_rev_8_21_14_0_10_56_10]
MRRGLVTLSPYQTELLRTALAQPAASGQRRQLPSRVRQAIAASVNPVTLELSAEELEQLLDALPAPSPSSTSSPSRQEQTGQAELRAYLLKMLSGW